MLPGSMQASFIISSEEISDKLGEKDILKYTDQLGFSDTVIRIYEGEALEELLKAACEQSGFWVCMKRL